MSYGGSGRTKGRNNYCRFIDWKSETDNPSSLDLYLGGFRGTTGSHWHVSVGDGVFT